PAAAGGARAEPQRQADGGGQPALPRERAHRATGHGADERSTYRGAVGTASQNGEPARENDRRIRERAPANRIQPRAERPAQLEHHSNERLRSAGLARG